MLERLVCLFGAALSVVSGAALARERDPRFPEPPALRAQVEFWKRVYVDIRTDAGFVHDNRHLDVVYETMHVPEGGARAREAKIKARKAYWRRLLLALGRGAHLAPAARADARTAAQAWRAALGRNPTRREYLAAADRLRFQRGQRNKFEQGLVRAGAHEAWMRRILAENGVPEDLVYLPHVESSFNPRAYSRHGAAGMWQFMPDTGRRYLRVDAVVDERLDPESATRAAARLLRDNYDLLGTWPLAITAYNHGAEGMRRARERVGSGDIAAIIARYEGPLFGFASRNFYPQFLAARAVAEEQRRHFGALAKAQPAPVERVRLPFYLDFRIAARALGVARARLEALNPALRPAVLRAEKYIPKGFALSVPRPAGGGAADAWLAQVAPRERHARQRPWLTHTVRRGETLSRIAARYHTTVARLVVANGIDDRHLIFPGQRLELAPAPRKLAERSASPVPGRLAEASRPPLPIHAPRRLAEASAPPVPPPSARAAPRPAAVEASVPPPVRRPVEGGWTVVAYEETLAHFADWLDLSPRTLRRLNHLSPRARLRVGQRLHLDFSKVSRQEFERCRVEHRRAIEERYLARYEITGTVSHTLRDGENLWTLAHKVYGLPSWLLHRYNPEAAGRDLMPGTRIRVPVVRPVRS